MRKLLLVGSCLATALALATPARAADVTFTGSSGTLAASVEFNTNAGNLVVTLTNTGSASVDPASVLTNVLFSCSGCGTLTAVSAVTSGPVMENGAQIAPTGTAVGGEWALVQSGTSIQIASSGANGAGAANFPPGDGAGAGNLEGPPSGAVDGVQYGIANSIAGNANTGVTGSAITIHDVIFTLTCGGAVQNCNNATFSGITFQYGTDSTEPSFGGGTGTGQNTGTGTATGQNLVPEPTSLLLFGSGLAATAYRARRKKGQKDS